MAGRKVPRAHSGAETLSFSHKREKNEPSRKVPRAHSGAETPLAPLRTRLSLLIVEKSPEPIRALKQDARDREGQGEASE